MFVGGSVGGGGGWVVGGGVGGGFGIDPQLLEFNLVVARSNSL